MLAVPFASEQVAVLVTALAVTAVGCVMVLDNVAVHPLAVVTVTL